MKVNKRDYLLVGLIVAFTGFEIIFRTSVYGQIIILAFIAYYFVSKNIKFNTDFFLIAIPFLIPAIFQAAKFDLYLLAIKNILGLLIQYLICYMVLEITKERFHITFVNFVYFLALFSLLFYPTQFFPPLQEFIKNTLGSLITPLGTADYPEGFRSKTLIFFTYMHNYGQEIVPGIMPRNCGAFWEPGMFAVFLNLALMINLFINHAVIFSRKNIVLILVIITTFSTTGFIVLFLIVLSKFFFQKDLIKIFLSFPIALSFFFFSYTYVWSADFMQEKIESNISTRGENKNSRFGAAVYHFTRLKEFPLAGVSMKVGTEENIITLTERDVTANGLSLVFFVYGIPFGVLYYIIFYKGIRRWLLFHSIENQIYHMFFFFIFILLAFSQDVTCRIFYNMILFFTICFPKSPLKESPKNRD
jgi:hypothetical protein